MVVVRQNGRAATVNVFEAEGILARVFDFTLHKDGWWPDGYSECAR